MNFTKVRNVIAGTAVSVMGIVSIVNMAPANANPVRIGQDTWSAFDNLGQEHVIKVKLQDREGDYLIEVTELVHGRAQAVNEVTEYWIDCKNDIISYVGGPGWENIDHRKMEGWYSDVACRLN